MSIKEKFHEFEEHHHKKKLAHEIDRSIKKDLKER
jgi:hypothetical protein